MNRIIKPGIYVPLGPNNELQYMEGKLEGCLGKNCKSSCCDDKRVEEWIPEYSFFHASIKDYLISKGINMRFHGKRRDLVRFTNCSDPIDRSCKFLKYATNRDVDPRPIDCKIYPYAVDWKTIDFKKGIVKVYLWDRGCPLVKVNAIPESFRNQVNMILGRDFGRIFHGMKFEFKYVNKVLK